MHSGLPLPKTSEDYLRVWTAVLGGWLGWSEPRVEAFILRWVERMQDEYDLFYHKLPLWYVTPVLVPPRLRLSSTPDQLHGIEDELEAAIMDYSLDYMTVGYDWEAARVRAAAVLQRHGAAFPEATDLAWYEKVST